MASKKNPAKNRTKQARAPRQAKAAAKPPAKPATEFLVEVRHGDGTLNHQRTFDTLDAAKTYAPTGTTMVGQAGATAAIYEVPKGSYGPAAARHGTLVHHHKHHA